MHWQEGLIAGIIRRKFIAFAGRDSALSKSKKGLTDLRTGLTPAQRASPLNHTIDPGFVHHSRIQTILGPAAMQLLDQDLQRIPHIPEGLKLAHINHAYTRFFLEWCNHTVVPPLGELVGTGEGSFFCSTERLAPSPGVYTAERVTGQWLPPNDSPWTVELRYSTARVTSDTLRERLARGDMISIVAQKKNVEEDRMVFEPLVMGFPWLEDGNESPGFDCMWWGGSFFENYVEDFDEFARVRELATPPSPEPMRDVSERSFKTCLAELLGDAVQGDWGGETSDFYATHLHLAGRRVTGAFLLKGPSDFRPMQLNHLGQNNDQIVRLSHEPADVLFVQHSHDIRQPVRETLRAFAVQPCRARSYCLIDGRDSLRLLRAYDLYDKAVEMTDREKPERA